MRKNGLSICGGPHRGREIVRATGEDEDSVAERIERRRSQLLHRLESEAS